MTHEELVDLFGHDQAVAATVFLERVGGLRLPTPSGTTPGERFAADTALLQGQGLAVTGYAAAHLAAYERHLDHRLTLEGAALQGDPHALTRLHVRGGLR